MRIFLSATLTLALLSTSLIAQQGPSPDERILLQLANQTRAEQGIPPLTWDPALARAARTHAARMMQESGPLDHQYPGEPNLISRAATAGAHFSTVSENLAAGGPNAAALHQKWMSTEVHRSNILNPDLTAVGIAVLQGGGALYAVQDFGRNVPFLHQNDVEKQAQKLLLDEGIKPATTNEDARKNCELTSGVAGHPLLVIRWEGSDLTQLPSAVLQQMPAARSHTAAVASCATTQSANAGFTTYRVAVLIY